MTNQNSPTFESLHQLPSVGYASTSLKQEGKQSLPSAVKTSLQSANGAFVEPMRVLESSVMTKAGCDDKIQALACPPTNCVNVASASLATLATCRLNFNLENLDLNL